MKHELKFEGTAGKEREKRGRRERSAGRGRGKARSGRAGTGIEVVVAVERVAKAARSHAALHCSKGQSACRDDMYRMVYDMLWIEHFRTL